MKTDYSPVALEHVKEAFRRLHPVEREVLGLSAQEALLNDEIAARLGIAPAEVERLLAEALLKLDRALERRDRRWWRLW